MKANEFVKKFGWEVALTDLRNHEKYNTRSILYNYDELKRLFESYELVNEFFHLECLGFDRAISIAKNQIKDLRNAGIISFDHKHNDDLTCTVDRMEQAIADVESCQ